MKKQETDSVDLQTVKPQTIFWLQVTTKLKTFIFAISLFFIPFVLGGPQLAVGSIVNFFLIRAAAELPLSYAWPLIVVSSMATFARGIMFGPFTIFMVYMIPAIRIGNFFLVYAVKYLQKRWLGILTWWAVKSVFLFWVAFLLFQSALLPKIFLTAMGIMQFATVLIGGSAFLLLRKRLS